MEARFNPFRRCYLYISRRSRSCLYTWLCRYSMHCRPFPRNIPRACEALLVGIDVSFRHLFVRFCGCFYVVSMSFEGRLPRCFSPCIISEKTVSGSQSQIPPPKLTVFFFFCRSHTNWIHPAPYLLGDFQKLPVYIQWVRSKNRTATAEIRQTEPLLRKPYTITCKYFRKYIRAIFLLTFKTIPATVHYILRT